MRIFCYLEYISVCSLALTFLQYYYILQENRAELQFVYTVSWKAFNRRINSYLEVTCLVAPHSLAIHILKASGIYF